MKKGNTLGMAAVAAEIQIRVLEMSKKSDLVLDTNKSIKVF